MLCLVRTVLTMRRAAAIIWSEGRCSPLPSLIACIAPVAQWIEQWSRSHRFRVRSPAGARRPFCIEGIHLPCSGFDTHRLHHKIYRNRTQVVNSIYFFFFLPFSVSLTKFTIFLSDLVFRPLELDKMLPSPPFSSRSPTVLGFLQNIAAPPYDSVIASTISFSS